MIFFLKHALTEGPGLLGAFFAQTSWRYRIVELWNKESLPDPASCEAIVTLGGPMNVYQTGEFPFLAAEEFFLRDALGRGVPILGICLGAQLLAKVGSAKVTRAPAQEIGWYPVRLTEQGRDNGLFESMPDTFDVFQWHADTFVIPQAGTLLVTAEPCRNQAFCIGDSAWGLQFHPEMNHEMLLRWLSECPDGFDAQLILSEYQRKKSSYERCAQTLFTNFARSIMRRNAGNN